MNNLTQFFPPQAFAFKGGGGGSQPSTPPAAPAAPTLQTPTPPSPPASVSAIEVTQAKLDRQKQAKARKGLASTILAGAGEGAGSDALGGTAAGKTTLLGGG